MELFVLGVFTVIGFLVTVRWVVEKFLFFAMDVDYYLSLRKFRKTGKL
jgi:hypothetical protein